MHLITAQFDLAPALTVFLLLTLGLLLVWVSLRPHLNLPRWIYDPGDPVLVEFPNGDAGGAANVLIQRLRLDPRFSNLKFRWRGPTSLIVDREIAEDHFSEYPRTSLRS